MVHQEVKVIGDCLGGCYPTSTVPGPPQSQEFYPTAWQHGLQVPLALWVERQGASASLRLTCENSGLPVAAGLSPSCLMKAFRSC